MERLKCTTCKKALTNASGISKFKCPKCLKTEFVRCQTCRKTAAKYYCQECSFEGPN